MSLEGGPIGWFKHRFLHSSLAHKASGSMILNVASKGITFITGVILARVMTQSAFGYYNFAEAWINLFSFFAMFGMNAMLTREISRQETLEKWSEMRGLLRWSDSVVWVASILLAVLAGGVFYALQGKGEFTTAAVQTLLVAMVLVPLTSMVRVRQAAILGFGHIVSGQLGQMLIRPLIFVVMVAAFGYFSTLNGPGAYVLRAIATLIALLASIWLLRKFLPKPVLKAKPEYDSKRWTVSGLTFMAAGTIAMVNQQLSVLLVGSFLGGEDTAIFAVAKKGAEFILFIPAAIYLTIGPTVARKYAADDHASLQRLLHKSVRWSVITAIVPAIGFLIFGKYFLLLHGSEYVAGWNVLIVLILTSIVFVVFGPTSLILNMTGFERYTAIGVLASTVINAVASIVLMRHFGLMGAAYGGLISMLAYKIGLTVTIYKLTNLRSFLRFF